MGCTVVYTYKSKNLALIKPVLFVITAVFALPFYKRRPSLPKWLYDCSECELDIDGQRYINPV